jgi:aerobic-type carbon monoxide dehydrogenase small subunit (CoxS/CutS family)
MILSLKVLLDRQPSPSLDDVKRALSGNLCRCGSYTKIFRATQDAAAALRRRS